MALKQTINKTCEAFVDFNGASVNVGAFPIQDVFVIHVTQVSGTKTNALAYVIFAGKEINYQKKYEFVSDMNGKNFIAQAYEHLKTLPEFASAIDC
jgi:hypothetical protein